MIDDATRVRCIRALLGITGKEFASRVGVSQTVVTSWEKGRGSPRRDKRAALELLCEKERIGFAPSGMPFPWSDLLTPEKING